ncbi:GH92 family glycosyl hydrolase [Kitasatospora sp. NPDC057015]|uniref:GH92 family glycosyl hydrolase n=1 Tax=Kitasatospora sp. NPDC057015 TaxID=3346001 RepID=UPI00363052A5
MLRSRIARAVSAALLAALGPAGTVAAPVQAADLPLTRYVDPFVGSDDSTAPDPVPGGAGGSTYPGAVVPFGGVQFSPDTPTASPSGYRYSDTSVESFSLTHFDGAGCPNNEDLPLLPVTGALAASPGTSWTDYASGYRKAEESASPGQYRTRLDRYGTDVELTATTRTGMGRLTYPSTDTARLLVATGRSATGDRAGTVRIDGSEVSGSVTAGGFCGSSKTYRIYFDLRFDREPTGFGTWSGADLAPGSASAAGTGTGTGAYLTFDTTDGRSVRFKVGLSYVSVEGARRNLAAENPGWDFDAVRAAADTAWNAALGRVRVGGGDDGGAGEGGESLLRTFYTALYHVFQSPNVSSDVDGDYRGFDGAVHHADHPVYQNYSGWDIYRSWAALVALLAPAEASDIARSMVLDGQQGGLLPKWSQQTNEDFVMNGDPGPIVVASLYAFGARDFDTAAALALMEKSSAGGTTQGGPIRGRQASYVRLQYIAGDPSDSLEYSASDFAVARFAAALGDTAASAAHLARAQWWRHTYGPESGYVQPRDAAGTWAWPLDPASGSGFTEGNAAQYTWMVPYDYAGLIDAMGGRHTAVQRLDHHFRELNAGQSRPYYYIGNEPEHGVPWAYDFARHPAGAADAVRRAARAFTTGPGGLPGNDDLGATSAWYVWAALGMYPVTPGADTLALHGPFFPSVQIHRPGGDIAILATGTGRYVQGLRVDGAATTRSHLRYPDLAGGAVLQYSMGEAPGAAWGTGAADVPPSFTDGAGAALPAAPERGPNLAAGGAAAGSAPCSADTAADRAFDGLLGSTGRWCSAEPDAWLRVDLGATRTVSSFVVEHAGLGGESTGRNTAAFRIETSTDGVTWDAAVAVTGSRASRTEHPVAPRPARYVRLLVDTAADLAPDGPEPARIHELEVYGEPDAAVAPGLRTATPAAPPSG